MFGLKHPAYIGVDIGASGIKLVELRLEKKRPVLFTYGLTNQAQDVHKLFTENNLIHNKKTLNVNNNGEKTKDEAVDMAMLQKAEQYAKILRAICKAAKVQSKKAVVGLPASSVFHAIVTLPQMKKQDFDHVLKAEVKKLLPMPMEEMALDYQILASQSSDKTQRVLVNAISYVLIAFYTKIFQRAGLTIDALEPEATALSRCLIGKDKAVAMVVDIGAQRTNFFIVEQCVPVTHRSIETGGEKIDKILKTILAVDEPHVEQLKYDLFEYLASSPASATIAEKRFLGLFMPVIDPIVKEIEISFELFLRQSGNKNKHPEKIILSGGIGLMPYLSSYISDKFKIKCYAGDPWARVVHQDGLRPILKQIAPRMSVAIGLAMRNMV